MSIAVLPAYLAKLAGPIGYDTGKAGVGQIGISGAAAAIESAAYSPATVHAVLQRRVQAEGVLRLENIKWGQLVSSAPEKLGPDQQVFINRAAQGFPAQREIRAIQIGQKIRWVRDQFGTEAGTVPARVRHSQVQVGGFGEIAVRANMAYNAGILPPVGSKHV